MVFALKITVLSINGYSIVAKQLRCVSCSRKLFELYFNFKLLCKKNNELFLKKKLYQRLVFTK